MHTDWAQMFGSFGSQMFWIFWSGGRWLVRKHMDVLHCKNALKFFCILCTIWGGLREGVGLGSFFYLFFLRTSTDTCISRQVREVFHCIRRLPMTVLFLGSSKNARNCTLCRVYLDYHRVPYICRGFTDANVNLPAPISFLNLTNDTFLRFC